MHEMTKHTAIPPKVKRKVWDRDGHCCILCGNPRAYANAHYIRRSQGGKGIDQNIVTLCPQCHSDYDNGSKRIEYGEIIRDYLKGCYKNWNEKDLVYDKWGWTNEVKR